MKFRAHETFHIRKGWLYKGLKNVETDPYVFMGEQGRQMDDLGIGANMVKSLRYWMQATELTVEPSSGRRYQEFTDFGRLIHLNDRYMEELGTLWLVHYKLARNKELATAWYFFYHHFSLTEFSREDFWQQVERYIREEGTGEVGSRSISDDFNCIISSYLPKSNKKREKISPENNLECPLTALNLIKLQDEKEKIYRKTPPAIESIHPLIALAVILHNAEGTQEIPLQTLVNQPGNLGKSFNLTMTSLMPLLSKLELLGHLRIVRTAGLDVVVLKDSYKRQSTEENFLRAISDYYNAIG